MSWFVVLGCSTGTGRAVAQAAADAGYDVFGIHRGNWPEGAAAVERYVQASGRRIVLWQADGAEPEAATRGAALLQEHAGPGSVRLFVHAIASASVGRLTVGDDPLAPRQLQSTFDRMAHSFVWWCHALHSQGLLDPQGAQLLGLSNLMTEHVIRGAAAISASKAALHQYVKHMAVELGPEKHRVNLLKFAMVLTEALHVTFSAEDVGKLVRTMERSVPAGRLLTVDEVGELVVWLASDQARWFNGAEIDFTGAESHAFFDALIYPDRDGGRNDKQ